MPLKSAAVGVALGLTLVVLFALCAGAELFGPTANLSHAWINLFTRAPMGSSREWIEGILGSFILGGVGGSVFAMIYNRLAPRN
jgi:hypothetical protein